MNNIFSFNRFAMLFRKHTSENLKFYLMSLFVLFGIIILFLTFQLMQDVGFRNNDKRQAVFTVFLFLAGTVFSSLIFSPFGKKTSATQSIILPCSKLEKYSIAWLYSQLIFPLVYIIIYYLVDYVFAFKLYSNNHFVPVQMSPVQNLELFSSDDYRVRLIIPVFIFLNSLSFFGSIFFRNYQYVKTGFGLILFVFLLIMFNPFIVRMFSGVKVRGLVLFSQVNVFRHGFNLENALFSPSTNVMLALGIFLLVFTPVMFWIIAYHKLREREL